VILGGEDVAARPAHLGAERDQRLDQHGRLNRHVQRAGDSRTLQWLPVGVLTAGGHQSRHLMLGEPDLLAAELGQIEVRDLEIGLSCSRAHRFSTIVIGLIKVSVRPP